jgi:hypothetical protein
MTNNTPLHLLTEAIVADLSTAEIDARLATYEGFDDPDETETPDGITLLYKERDRRAGRFELPDSFYAAEAARLGIKVPRKAPRKARTRKIEPPPTAGWFLATVRPMNSNVSAVVLVQARAGADVEDALRRWGFDAAGNAIAWQPLGDVKTPIASDRVVVIPEGC